jgi:hypothetical protein
MWQSSSEWYCTVLYRVSHKSSIIGRKGKTKAFIYIPCSICAPLFSVHKFSRFTQSRNTRFFLEHTYVGVSIDMFIKKEGAYDAILPNATPYHQPRCSLFLWISIPVWVMQRPVAGVLSIYLTISIKNSFITKQNTLTLWCWTYGTPCRCFHTRSENINEQVTSHWVAVGPLGWNAVWTCK